MINNNKSANLSHEKNENEKNINININIKKESPMHDVLSPLNQKMALLKRKREKVESQLALSFMKETQKIFKEHLSTEQLSTEQSSTEQLSTEQSSTAQFLTEPLTKHSTEYFLLELALAILKDSWQTASNTKKESWKKMCLNSGGKKKSKTFPRSPSNISSQLPETKNQKIGQPNA